MRILLPFTENCSASPKAATAMNGQSKTYGAFRNWSVLAPRSRPSPIGEVSSPHNCVAVGWNLVARRTWVNNKRSGWSRGLDPPEAKMTGPQIGHRGPDPSMGAVRFSVAKSWCLARF